MILLYNPCLKSTARKLRSQMTHTEKILWSIIRRKQLYGVQFYRQKAIGSYIVDFYGPSVNLVIEIDGVHHLFKENLEQDQYRDAYLQKLGIRVIRFKNDQIKNTLFKVVEQIKIAIKENKINFLPTLKKGVAGLALRGDFN